MGSFRRRVNGLLSVPFPEKRLFIQSGDSTRYIRLTPLSQFATVASGLVVVGWMAVATATVLIDHVAGSDPDSATVVMRGAYETRLDELAAERDRRAGEARSAQTRFQLAMEQVSRQQSEILAAVEERRELSTALDLMRARLAEAVEQRDIAAAANDRLLAQVDAKDAGPNGADLTTTLRAVTAALSDAVVDRDSATADRTVLQQQLAGLELRMQVNGRRQDEMINQLEQAVAASFGPLEGVFAKSNLDVDDLLATVRSNYTGQGGPLEAATVSTRSFDDPALGPRFDRLMSDIDRANLMRIAAGKIPYSVPVLSDFRFTSGFGYRRDPKGRGTRMHAGIDLAGPRGTAIFATAAGVVTDAGYESGYGNVVRIRHDFGFETVYAHQSRIRVRVGQTVSRGDRIGDMGSTGRSTGSHLHYEVHVNGRPVNPMTYLEAAKDVF